MAKNIDAYRKSSGEKIDSISKDILLRKLYETGYGIHDHFAEGNSKPFSLYAARKSDELFLYSLLARDMGRFVDNEIFQNTGTSWESFKNLPVAEAELMVKLSERKVKQANRVTGAANKELENQLGKVNDLLNDKK